MSIRRLQWIAAVAAGLAAFCWLMSAWGSYPAMRCYWGYVPASDPFQAAFAAAAHWNFWAALFAAIAASVEATTLGMSRRR